MIFFSFFLFIIIRYRMLVCSIFFCQMVYFNACCCKYHCNALLKKFCLLFFSSNLILMSHEYLYVMIFRALYVMLSNGLSRNKRCMILSPFYSFYCKSSINVGNDNGIPGMSFTLFQRKSTVMDLFRSCFINVEYLRLGFAYFLRQFHQRLIPSISMMVPDRH